MGIFSLVGSKDIGMDLGTSNILLTIKGKGIVLNEPAVVAIKRQNNEIVATGHEAKEMIGRTPEQIRAVRPMKDGVIADFTATQLMIKNIITKVCKRYNVGRPRVVVGVPSGITEVEERAVEEAVSQAGAREVFLIEEPMAAAIGAGLDVAEPTGNMVVDIGAGTTEVAVISLGGIVVSDSIKIAGDAIDDEIINYIKNNLNLAIGYTTAEQVKLELGCAMPLVTQKSLEIRGRELTTGLPENKIVTSEQVQEAMAPIIERIIDLIKATLNKTGYTKALELENSVEAETRIENLEEFLTVAIEFEEQEADNTLAEFLENITLSSDIDGMENQEDSVTLMTLHSAQLYF